MSLVTSKEMFRKAYDGGYAIGAFNVNNMEIVQGITEAAKEVNAPLILQVSKGARAYANHTYLIKLVEAAMEDSGLDIALHLDHGEDFDICKKCVDDGFSSVMIDGSKHPFTAHTTNRVPFIIVDEKAQLTGIEDGRLSDIAPTMLTMAGIEPSAEMTGRVLATEA